jgi:hypothetical protein
VLLQYKLRTKLERTVSVIRHGHCTLVPVLSD